MAKQRRPSRKLTPDLEREVLKQAGGGASTRQIAAWLGTAHGVKMSHQGVGAFLRATRQTRAEVAKVVVREALSGTITSDLDRLAREQRRVERVAARLYRKATEALDRLGANPADAANCEVVVELALKTTDRIAKLAQIRLHFAGADSDDGASDLDEAAERLRSRIDSLASTLRAAADAGEAGTDGEGRSGA